MRIIMIPVRSFTPPRHPKFTRLSRRIAWTGGVVLGAFLGFMIVMLAGAVLLKLAKRGAIWIIPLVWLFLKIQKLEKSNREFQSRISALGPAFPQTSPNKP